MGEKVEFGTVAERIIKKANLSVYDISVPPEVWREENWQMDAACGQVNVDMFTPDDEKASKLARAVCLRCDVRAQCLKYALENDSKGIWGGLNTKERKRIKEDSTLASS